MKRAILISVLAAGVLLSSCAKDDLLRTEGPTLGAGDSIATNTALQIIDPWPAGVEDTDIVVPNSRGGDAGKPSATAATTTAANP